jgi:hypothetical protein
MKRRNEDDVGPVQNGISWPVPEAIHTFPACGKTVEKAAALLVQRKKTSVGK